MPPRWNENRLTAKIGIDYPIIQGPLGGLSSQKLTAAVSNFGGLGSFGAHGLTPGAIKDAIAEIRSLTSKPFAMNLWVSTEDEGARTSNENAFNRSLAPLAAHIAALGSPRPEYKHCPWIRFEDQVRDLFSRVNACLAAPGKGFHQFGLDLVVADHSTPPLEARSLPSARQILQITETAVLAD